MISTEILQHVKNARTRKKEKQPLLPDPFTVVGMIVLRHELDDGFLASLRTPPDLPSLENNIHGPLRRKNRLNVPPFFVSEQSQYLLTRKILAAVSNPYLRFARSPEEIRLSIRLYSMNPLIETELLENRHFETLLLSELAKIRIGDLLSAIERKKAKCGQPEAGAGGSFECLKSEDMLRGQIKSLEDFILFIETQGESWGAKWAGN